MDGSGKIDTVMHQSFPDRFFKGVKMDHDGIGISQTSRLC